MRRFFPSAACASRPVFPEHSHGSKIGILRKTKTFFAGNTEGIASEGAHIAQRPLKTSAARPRNRVPAQLKTCRAGHANGRRAPKNRLPSGRDFAKQQKPPLKNPRIFARILPAHRTVMRRQIRITFSRERHASMRKVRLSSRAASSPPFPVRHRRHSRNAKIRSTLYRAPLFTVRDERIAFPSYRQGQPSEPTCELAVVSPMKRLSPAQLQKSSVQTPESSPFFSSFETSASHSLRAVER